MPDPDPSAPTPAPTGTPKIFNYDFDKETYYFSSDFSGVAPASIREMRWLTGARVTPPSGADDTKVGAGITVLDIMWARKGDIWLSTILNADLTYETDKGVTGTAKANAQLFYQPLRWMQVSVAFGVDGSYNSITGFKGSVHLFDGSIQAVDKKSMLGVGIVW